MLTQRIAKYIQQSYTKYIFGTSHKETELIVPKTRGAFDPYVVFPVKFKWQKYLEIPEDELVAWEKFDKALVFSWWNSFSYRKLGLVFDDLASSEQPAVIEAINRLPKEVKIARSKRIGRAMDLSFHKKILDESEWTPIELDVPYLSPYIKWVEAEMEESDAEVFARNDIPLPPYQKYDLDEMYHAGRGKMFQNKTRLID
eukprot:gene320-6734_t